MRERKIEREKREREQGVMERKMAREGWERKIERGLEMKKDRVEGE